MTCRTAIQFVNCIFSIFLTFFRFFLRGIYIFICDRLLLLCSVIMKCLLRFGEIFLMISG